jgi:gliding motility-associated-like protein
MSQLCKYLLKISACFPVLLFLSCPLAFSQLTAAFNLSTGSGCSPLVVYFFNSSTGAIGYNWNFGNGNISVEQNPMTTYLTPGTYQVILTVYDNVSSASVSHTITVFPNPNSNFIADVNQGCVGTIINFTNLSTPGSPGNSPIVNSFWDFGDGSTLNSMNNTVSHVFTFSGDFSITLIVTDQNGCTKTKTVYHYIHVSSPSIYFFAPVQDYCSFPDTVEFINGSYGQGALTYLWNFGDGQTSTLEEPVHIYSGFGNYTVSLTATDENNCISTSTMVDYIHIHPISPSFTMPDTLCIGETFGLVNTSTGGNEYLWNINGDTTSVDNPTGLSSDQGGYIIINLTGSLNGECSVSYTDSIFVESINADFEPDPWYLCQIPNQIHFINLSTTNSSAGIATSLWEFGNLYTSNDFSPINHYYSDPVLDSIHTEVFTDMLIVSSPHGCTDTFINEDDVLIILPIPDLLIEPFGGCFPYECEYFDASYYNSQYDSIVSWYWILGDGTFYNGQYPPGHTYADTGIYAATLTITTAIGCTATSDIFPVQVGLPQYPDFTWISPNDTVCASDCIQFISLSTDSNYITLYNWYFGDSIHQWDEDPVHCMIDTGWLDVTLMVGDNMCFTDTTMYDIFYIEGPITSMTYSTNCDDPYHYHFFPNADYWNPVNSVQYFYWDFGDGSPFDSLYIDTEHDYTVSGYYNVLLHSFNDSTQCSYIDTVQVNVRKAIAVIETDTVKFCTYDSITFYSGNSHDEYEFSFIWPYCTGYYQWNFGDGTTFGYDDLIGNDTIIPDASITHVFTEPGIYDVRLIVQDQNGCRDTSFLTVRAYAPNSAFFATPDSGCIPLNVHFNYLPFQDTTITNWYWSFGDSLASVSSIPYPTFTYTETGFYNVSLVLVDIIGCRDTTVIDSMISTASPEIEIQTTGNFCIGNEVQFLTDTSEYNYFYSWDFGDGTVFTSFTPGALHTYNIAGNYTISLYANANGCTATDILQEEVQDPSFEIIVSENNIVCFPTLVIPAYTPDDPDFNWWIWSFGDNSFSMLQHPEHVYVAPGEYLVTLSMQTTNHCMGHDIDTVEVLGINANLIITDTKICLGDSILYLLNNVTNVAGFIIDFGDGSPFGTSVPVYHTYNDAPATNLVYPSLVYWSDDSTCVKSESTIFQVYNIRSIFSRGADGQDTDTLGCVPFTVDFVNQSIGATEYNWYISNGYSASTSNISYTFEQAGYYTVTLTVSNEYCTVKLSKKIHALPVPDIRLQEIAEICTGDSIQLQAHGGIIYEWSPPETLSDPYSPAPVATPLITTSYSVTVTNEYTCKSTAVINVFVQQPPFIVIQDTSVIIGEIVNISDNPLYHVQYYWSPDYGLSCNNCYNPVFMPLETTTYYVTMTAYAGDKICFVGMDTVTISIIEEYSLDMPDAFTPDGDGNNDLFIVRGWGLKSLMEFKIYNRWGQLIFETDDIGTGWDGTYNRQPQSIDTYVYFVKAKTYSGAALEKKGVVTLLR